jgi:hypothetical protein
MREKAARAASKVELDSSGGVSEPPTWSECYARFVAIEAVIFSLHFDLPLTRGTTRPNTKGPALPGREWGFRSLRRSLAAGTQSASSHLGAAQRGRGYADTFAARRHAPTPSTPSRLPECSV